MKKFNTILAIAAVALTSVFGLSSCDKNDDAFSQPVQPRIQTHTVITNVPTGSTSNVNNDNNNNVSENNNANVNEDNGSKKETKSASTEKAGTTVQDAVGTYKYITEDGKEWIIELTENTGNSANKYAARITVPEGTPIVAKTYEGEYMIFNGNAQFYSYEYKDGDKYAKAITFRLEVNKNNPQSTIVMVKFASNNMVTYTFSKQ